MESKFNKKQKMIHEFHEDCLKIVEKREIIHMIKIFVGSFIY